MSEWEKQKNDAGSGYVREFTANGIVYSATVIDRPTNPIKERYICSIWNIEEEILTNDGNDMFFTTSPKLGKEKLDNIIYDMQFSDRILAEKEKYQSKKINRLGRE